MGIFCNSSAWELGCNRNSLIIDALVVISFPLLLNLQATTINKHYSGTLLFCSYVFSFPYNDFIIIKCVLEKESELSHSILRFMNWDCCYNSNLAFSLCLFISLRHIFLGIILFKQVRIKNLLRKQ